MPNFDSVLSECVTVKEYADGHHKSPQWVYRFIDLGMPVIRTGRRNGIKIHPPTANRWHMSRNKSRRKPARAA